MAEKNEVAVPAHKKILSAADILNCNDRMIVEVPVPEWGGVVRLQELSAKEAIEFNAANQGPAQSTANVRIVQKCAVDADGNKLFPDPNTLEKLKEKSVKVFNRLARRALEINGFVKEVQDEIKND